MNLIKRLFQEEEGQGLVEYVLIIAIISICIIVFGPTLVTAITGVFTKIVTKLTGAIA